MRSSRLGAVLWLCCAAGVCAGSWIEVQSAVGAVPAPELAAEQAEREAQARASAQTLALLNSVPMPPGTTRLTAEPGDDGGALSPRLPGGVPRRFEAAAVAWGIVEEPASSVLAYFREHPPAGAQVYDRFPPYAPQPPLAQAGIGFPETADGDFNELSGEIEMLAVEANRTELRVDAVAWWRGTPLTIPAGARLLRITLPGRRPRRTARGRRTTAPREKIVTTPRKIEAIRALLDRLPAEGRHVRNVLCPVNLGTATLAFYPRREPAGEPEATAELVDGGCGGASVAVEGDEGPPLVEEQALTRIVALAGIPHSAF